MVRPSFIASGISGTIILIAFILFFIYLKNKNEDTYKLIVLLSLIGIGFGVHGISHSYEEIYFDFNPFIGKWYPKNEPKINF